ncbi:hypothetical protein OMW55_11660 [Sphingomonas sp. BN140010]|uniref:Uncharacterized protein n=1 Tax=Sphingomonas arvum TaxID=2992113 RepID=A0ABT3JI63_9SPHN|nr:hypothetical protein [Sphingomonas sp. BN140010]MCW3798461.1 hypothetical protein [Sphingomonas sp. BN140010]
MSSEDLEQRSARVELHFLAAIMDELMQALLVGGIMSRAQVQSVENAVSARIGTEPRVW